MKKEKIMHYQEFQPSPSLARFIKCFWILQSNEKPIAPSAERILPDGCMEVIFHFREPLKRYTSKQTSGKQPRSFVSGQIKRYILIEPTGQIGILGVRFHPGGPYPFLRVPIRELTEKTVGLDLIWGKVGKEIESKILEARTNHERLQQVEKFLINQLNGIYDFDKIVETPVKCILKANGQISIDSLINNVGISSRQLERKFIQMVGISPKLFSRIIRFQKIFTIFEHNQKDKLTRLAYDCGYYDQAHFIRDFKKFSGQNPSDYFSQLHSMSNFFTSKQRMSNLYNTNY